jgi:hypothetical protein
MPFKNFHQFGGWQDSFVFGRLSAAHRNSFEEILDRNEKCYKQEGLESCVGSFSRPQYRSHYFECLNNLE